MINRLMLMGGTDEVHALPETNHETEQLQTIDALAQERQKRKAAEAQALSAASPATDTAAAQGAEGGIGGLEEEAGQQGAFNPETGEINWDCPCLGGMANGPCGEEFKAAFSCFVYSQEEPKGMDCIDKFKCVEDAVYLREIYC
jgi:intermembrane space import and assembly protein 40